LPFLLWSCQLSSTILWPERKTKNLSRRTKKLSRQRNIVQVINNQDIFFTGLPSFGNVNLNLALG
jgi:hypothetical protein